MLIDILDELNLPYIEKYTHYDGRCLHLQYNTDHGVESLALTIEDYEVVYYRLNFETVTTSTLTEEQFKSLWLNKMTYLNNINKLIDKL